MTKKIFAVTIMCVLVVWVVGLTGCNQTSVSTSDVLKDAAIKLLEEADNPEEAYLEFVTAFENSAKEHGEKTAIAELNASINNALKTEQGLLDLITASTNISAGMDGGTNLKSSSNFDTIVIPINGIWTTIDGAITNEGLLKVALEHNESIKVEKFWNPSFGPGKQESLLGGVMIPISSPSLEDLLDGNVERSNPWKWIDLMECAQQWTELEWSGYFDIVSVENYLVSTLLADRIQEYVDLDIKVVLVPHSQGSFYVRDALELLDQTTRESVAVVEIASPSKTMLSPSYRIDVLQDPVSALSGRSCEDWWFDDGTCNSFTIPWVSGNFCTESHYFETSYMVGVKEQAIVDTIENYREMLLEGIVMADFPDVGLISSYKLDGINGAVVDSFGNNDGTNNGAVRGVAGKIGSSFLFDNSLRQQISIPDSSDFHPINNFTISAWVKPLDFPDSLIIFSSGWQEPAPSFKFIGIMFGFNPLGKLFLETRGSDGIDSITSSSEIPSNIWVHVAVVVNKYNNASLYINGVLDNEAPILSPEYKSENEVYIGARHDALIKTMNWFDGNIDDVNFWERALTPSEIRSICSYELTYSE